MGKSYPKTFQIEKIENKLHLTLLKIPRSAQKMKFSIKDFFSFSVAAVIFFWCIAIAMLFKFQLDGGKFFFFEVAIITTCIIDFDHNEKISVIIVWSVFNFRI